MGYQGLLRGGKSGISGEFEEFVIFHPGEELGSLVVGENFEESRVMHSVYFFEVCFCF